MIFSKVGLAALAAVTVLVIWLFGGLNMARLDLTEDSLYSLSEGTANMLNRLEEPVKLKLFYSKKATEGEPHIRNYAIRITELLQEYAQLSSNKLSLEVVDPEPFSETEDEAAGYGLQGIELNRGEKVYLGLVAIADTKADSSAISKPRSEVITFLHPDKERFLEYDISNLIFSVSRATKPKVGILSNMSFSGDFNVMSQQMSSGWISVSQLERFYEVETLSKDVERIPEDISALVLILSEELPQSGAYAVDQYVMDGGHVLAFLDPFAEAAGQASGMMGMESEPKSAYMKDLLKAWGVEIVPDKFVADNAYALSVSAGSGQPMLHLGALGVTPESFNESDVVTSQLKNLNFSSAGAIRALDNGKTTIEPLVQSSTRAALMDVTLLHNMMDPRTLYRNFEPTGDRYIIAARVTGDVSTAFPNGAPKSSTKEAAPKTAESVNNLAPAEKLAQQKSEKKKAKHPKKLLLPAHKATPEKPLNIILVADTDILSNRLWVQVNQFFGQQILSPFAGNGDFLLNLVGNLQGDPDVISIRSRGQYARPFTKVQELEKEAQTRFLQKEEELTARLQETENKLNALQQNKEGQDVLVLSPEQQLELDRFQKQKIKIRKELREVQHQLNSDIERLGVILKIINILLIPILLTVLVLWLRVRRKRLLVRWA